MQAVGRKEVPGAHRQGKVLIPRTGGGGGGTDGGGGGVGGEAEGVRVGGAGRKRVAVGDGGGWAPQEAWL